MIRQLRSFTIVIAVTANIVIASLMLLTGYADHANPTEHPYIANAGLAFPIFLLANMMFLVFWVVFKWRLAVIPIVAYLSVIAPLRIYLPLNGSEEPPSNAFRVLSYNVSGMNFGGDAASPQRIADYIVESGAAIVCLQEANVPEAARQRLDSVYKYSSIDIISQDKGNSVAIYSLFPMVKKERVTYKSKGNGSMAYYLKIGRDTVLVINNHLESTHLSPDERQRYKTMIKGEMAQDTARVESRRILQRLGESSRLRAPQAEAIHHYIMCHSNLPVIVCGDFNDSPISYTRRTIAEGLTDCYAESGNGLGFSFNPKGFFVRIDNILCSSHYKPYAAYVDNNISVSDHYPISCWLARDLKH